MAASLAQQCAKELAGLAQKLLERVPQKEEWTAMRRFLSETIRLLGRGNIMAGVSAFQRVLPFVEKALGQVDRYMKVTDTYQVTETISEHFLVDEDARKTLEKFLAITKTKMACLKESIELFGAELDRLLEAIIKDGAQMGFFEVIRLAFQMNRISAQIHTVEDRLRRARNMLDQLDTHVAGKSCFANLLSYLAFFGSIAFSATGNLPAAAGCLATATASRRSAQGLGEYRQRLAEIDRDHKELQSQLSEWHFRFRAEQRNFLLLTGVKYALLFLLLLAVCFFFLGKAANFLFFAATFLFLVVKAEETNGLRYFTAIGLALLAIVMEFQKHHGLVAFNTGAAIFLTVQFLGFLEII